MVSCSGFGLPMHAQLLRLFVTAQNFQCILCGCCRRRWNGGAANYVIAGNRSSHTHRRKVSPSIEANTSAAIPLWLIGTCRFLAIDSTPLPFLIFLHSGLARRCAPALPCLAVFLGAGELPRRLVFSCVCAGMVPVAPAVGAVLVCACGPGGRWCGLMCV